MISDQKKLQHLAIIMDGNGRWASKNMFKRIEGHKKGINSVELCIKYCIKNNIPYLSLYTFSTENWKRPNAEVTFLMELLEKTLKNKIPELLKENIDVNILGDITKLPKSIQNFQTQKKILQNPSLVVNLMINYGARSEILNACREISKKFQTNIKAITNETLESFLYTKNMPDPDLLIRTGGEQRLSNFLLWQCAYTEFYFSDTLWPDYKEKDLELALKSFAKRKRRFGSIE